MKASTFAISLFVTGILTCCATAAEVRTWTDSSGKTLSGALEEVTSDGKVKIKSNGQTFTIPIERFSDVDREYIDSHKDEMDKEDSSSTRRRRKSDLFDYRQWKDNEDNEIKAKYVRFHEGKVVLLQGRTSHQISFYDLSDEDQVYLRRELEARGEENQIPPPTLNTRRDGTGAISEGGNLAFDPRMGNQAAPPAYAPPAMDDFAKKQQEEHAKMRREIEQKEAENRRAAEEQKRQQEANERRRQQEQEERVAQQNQRIEEQRHQQLARMNTGPQMEMEWVEYKICGSCSKQIDKSITAGDRCPHCNVFISEEQDRFGNTTKKVEVPWTLKGGIWNGAMIGGAIGIIVGFLKWLLSGDK